MSDWHDLEGEFRRAIDALSQNIAQVCADCAAIYTMELEGTVPVGSYGDSPLLRQAMLQTGDLQTTEGMATIGISPLSLLGDPENDAPRGTIRAFLAWWDKTQVAEEDDETPTLGIGEPFIHAWWSLSKQQKEALEEQREAGKFGGKPPMAPYWWVQEEGNAGARVLGQHYIARAWNLALPKMNTRVLQLRLF